MAIAVSDWGFDHSASGSRRWSACFAAILVLHVVGLWLAVRFWQQSEPLPAGAPPVAMIELAPLPVAPPVVTPAPPPEPAPPPPPLEETAPPSPALIVPVPLPPQPKPVLKRPPPPHEAPRIMATPVPSEAPPAPAPPAAAVSAPRLSNAVPTWQSALLARLEQFKRYPSMAQFRRQQGVVQLRFTMDRQGHVLSAQIVKSSGFDALDDETLALVHRAEPLPPPPAEISGTTLSLTVPVQFFLK
jgi:protein TonB